MQKPNAILHMTGYGLIYGLLLAMLYIWSILLLASLGGGVSLGGSLSMILSTAYFALILGAIPGTIMGFVEGWLLWYLTRNIQLPITEAEIATRRKVALGVLGGLTFAGMLALFMNLFVNASFTVFMIPPYVIPPFIAAAAAMYAVHRYFLKLQAWGSGGKAKNKAKHAPTNQLADEDATDDDSVLTDEASKQINNTRR